MRFKMVHFYKRICYKGELSEISKIICKDFDLGEFKSNKLVEVGYEDFNFLMETTKGKYFIKIFSNFRKDDDCRRYVDMMLKALEKGISFPKLFKSKQGYFHVTEINKAKLRFVVMQFIDGEDYFNLGTKPASGEIKELARQVALINSIDAKPPFVYDSWAIVNILKEYEQKGKYLLPEDAKLVKPLVLVFKDLNINELPHCFVHGDLIATNIMKDKNNKLWVIDFAVSNYYPRIQELAVMACNIFFDENSKENSESNLRIALGEYQKHIKLTSRELEILPTYVKLAHAMHVLRANYEKIEEKNNTEENEYWLNQGRIGLREQ